MKISNPSFTKFLRGLRKSFAYSFSKPEMADEGLFVLRHKTQKFANKIGKQLDPLSRKRQIYFLEQLLIDFSECRDEIYVERPSPKEKDSGYNYFKKFADVRSRLRLKYDIIDQLESDLFMLETAIIEALPDEDNEETANIDMALVAQIATSTTFNLAHELVRRRLSRLIGREAAMPWVLDPYDRVRERMAVADLKEEKEGVYVSRSLNESIKYYQQLDKSASRTIRYKEVREVSVEPGVAPLAWNASPMHLVELLVELHRKGFTELPEQNQVAIAKGVCGLFNVSYHTMKRYITEKMSVYDSPRSTQRADAFSNLSNLPAVKKRKFGSIKPAEPDKETALG